MSLVNTLLVTQKITMSSIQSLEEVFNEDMQQQEAERLMYQEGLIDVLKRLQKVEVSDKDKGSFKFDMIELLTILNKLKVVGD